MLGRTTTRPPLVVAWEVTRACPLACRHCRAVAQPERHPAELTLGEGRALIADVAQAFPGAVAILTGGEPLSRPDTLELAATGSSAGLQMALSVDVGWLLTRETCSAIREAGVGRVSFSIHFPDAARSDRFASTPGFHRAALAGLAELRAAGVPFQLHTTVMRSNVALLPRLHALVGELDAAAADLPEGARPEILVQVDLAGEATKFGAPLDEADRIVAEAVDARAVRLAGLMLLPPWNEDQEQTRPWFVRLRELRERLLGRGVPASALRHLSMGMSHDFEAAIEEGSTIVRVGTAIFGKRETRT